MHHWSRGTKRQTNCRYTYILGCIRGLMTGVHHPPPHWRQIILIVITDPNYRRYRWTTWIEWSMPYDKTSPVTLTVVRICCYRIHVHTASLFHVFEIHLFRRYYVYTEYRKRIILKWVRLNVNNHVEWAQLELYLRREKSILIKKITTFI